MGKWDKLKSASEIPIGGLILDVPTSTEYKTGSWRALKPVHDPKICINCLRCWIFCPEGSVKVKDGKFDYIDMDFCKGCGICAHECPAKEKGVENPRKALEMVEE